MQTRNRVLDDIAKMAGGAASILAGFKEEIEALVKARAERILGAMDLVPRDEFEAVRAMAQKPAPSRKSSPRDWPARPSARTPRPAAKKSRRRAR